MKSIATGLLMVLMLVLTLTAVPVHAQQTTDFMKIGNEALTQRKYDIAVEYYSKALMFQRKSAPQAHYNRGLAYSRLNQDSNALADYSAFIEYFPEAAQGYVARGVLFQKMGDRPRAIADLSKALEYDSTNGIAWAVLGDAYLNQRETVKALSAWQNSLDRDPNGPYAIHAREQIARVNKSAQRTKE